jgi:hypothetical protein
MLWTWRCSLLNRPGASRRATTSRSSRRSGRFTQCRKTARTSAVRRSWEASGSRRLCISLMRRRAQVLNEPSSTAVAVVVS